MVKFIWHDGNVPQGLKITQVYGIIFTKDGRILIAKRKDKNGNTYYSLAGGRPEPFDKDFEDTLRRELIEEVNTTIEKPILVGYQEVDIGDNSPTFAQLRMVAVVDKIGKKQPDPDNGETYDRLLTTYPKAIKLINWGIEGKMQIEASAKIAHEKLGVNFINDKEEYV